MSIRIEDNIFTLESKNTSYQMKVSEFGHLIHTYYGRRIEGDASVILENKDRGYSPNPVSDIRMRGYSIDYLPLEISGFGSGDYRINSVIARNADGSASFNPLYEGYEILKGKYRLSPLPSFFSDGGETLVIKLRDKASGLIAKLCYYVFEQEDVIARSLILENSGTGTIILEKALSASIDFMYGKYDVISFPGRHCYERSMNRERVGFGEKSFSSRRGYSSHQMNPSLILAEANTDETKGECYAFSLVYSGSFTCSVEKSQYGSIRVQMGVDQDGFSYTLKEGESFTSPELVLSFSDCGLEMLSNNLHQCARKHLIRNPRHQEYRPVVLNSWEGCYFNFSAENIIALARDAGKLGIDMVVMDDGWFGKRDDDTSGLGDWFVNEKKLGMSLGKLVEKVNELGVRFGIWFEPEMISEDSELYRKHPDWVLAVPGRDRTYGRSQLVLDFSRKEVRDGIMTQMDSILGCANIEYIKWDANRHISDFFSLGLENQGEVGYRYMLGLYEFLENLMQKYPNLLMEGCSGGGGRFDYGMLHYFPYIWTSDNTDPVARLFIQRGTSFFYPPETMSCHVSASPNHQNGRITPFKTRTICALTGSFGYELVPSKLSDEEKHMIAWAIEKHHAAWPLISKGRYYRLSDPAEEEFYAWQLVSEDGRRSIVSMVRRNLQGNALTDLVRLRGLDEKAIYLVDGKEMTGSLLMNAGLVFPSRIADYDSYYIEIERK